MVDFLLSIAKQCSSQGISKLKQNEEVCNFSQKSCKPCEGEALPLEKIQIENALKEIPKWQLDEKEQKFIFRKFSFNDHYQTIAFVNAIAFISHKENHHPDLKIGYNYCNVYYKTHAMNALSENDFICAAKIEKLLEL